MLETKERLIGSHRYYVTELPSSQARALLIRLVQIAGPVLASMLEDGGLMEGDTIAKVSQMDTHTLARMVRDFAGKVKPEDLEYLCRVLGDTTEVSTEAGQVPLDLEKQEIHFSGGNLNLLFRWLAFALEVQYADFFPKPVTGPRNPLTEKPADS